MKTLAGESILWQGRPIYARWLGLLVLYPVTLFSLIYIDPTLFHVSPAGLEQLRGAFFITGLGALLWLRLIFKYGKVSYFITDRRIVRRQNLPVLRALKEIPLVDLSAVKSRRSFRKGFIVFVSSKAVSITFGYLKDDPESLRRLVETASRNILAGGQA